METKTAYQVVTIDTLKQQARERQEARDAEELDRLNLQHTLRTARNSSLTAFLKATQPYAALFASGDPITLGDEEIDSRVNDTQDIVAFRLPHHADVEARFVWEKNGGDIPGHWEHQGFLSKSGYEYSFWSADPKKMWQVREWTGTGYEPDAETAYAKYRRVDFEDLGEALLYAERVYRDPADIQREVDDLNARRLTGTTAAHLEIPPPEPTAAESLVSALKRYIDEQIIEDRRMTYIP